MTSETAVEQRLKTGVEMLGGRAWKLLPWVQRGLPDRLVVLPGQVWFVELKKRTGRLASHQRRMRNLLVSYKLNWAVLYTREQVDAWLEQRRGEQW